MAADVADAGKARKDAFDEVLSQPREEFFARTGRAFTVEKCCQEFTYNNIHITMHLDQRSFRALVLLPGLLNIFWQSTKKVNFCATYDAFRTPNLRCEGTVAPFFQRTDAKVLGLEVASPKSCCDTV